jgi:hypothetical protein
MTKKKKEALVVVRRFEGEKDGRRYRSGDGL